jgi:hypothetical protein
MEQMTPVKAIREFCLECAGSRAEVRGCKIAKSALYPYRLGKNPARKGIGGHKTLPFGLRNP